MLINVRTYLEGRFKTDMHFVFKKKIHHCILYFVFEIHLKDCILYLYLKYFYNEYFVFCI